MTLGGDTASTTPNTLSSLAPQGQGWQRERGAPPGWLQVLGLPQLCGVSLSLLHAPTQPRPYCSTASLNPSAGSHLAVTE